MTGVHITLRQQSLIDLAERIIPYNIRNYTKKLLYKVIYLANTHGGDLNILIPAALFSIPYICRCMDAQSTKNKLMKHQQRIRNILSDIERADVQHIDKIILLITHSSIIFTDRSNTHEANILHDALALTANECLYIADADRQQGGFSLLQFIRQEKSHNNMRM